MNKHLTNSLLLVAACLAFTSCSKSKDLYDPERPEMDAQELYAKNFLAYVGGSIHKDVDWGFHSKSKSSTRAEDASITLSTKNPVEYSIPYIKLVRNYFPEGQAPSTDVTSWEFLHNTDEVLLSLIYTNTVANDEVWIYYYDPATEKPEDAKRYKLIDNIQNDLGPYYQKMIINEKWESPISTEGYAMWDRGVQKIQSYPFRISMNKSYYFGLYVTNKDTGKSYYTNMNLNENKNDFSGAVVGKDREEKDELINTYVFGLSDDGQPGCELIFTVLKNGPQVVQQEVTPDPPAPVLEWHRIIAEDLNVHDTDGDKEEDDTDFDFNDIVLDVALVDGGAKCVLQAAGATLKIRINGDDNLEVHKLFNVAQEVMVNTNAAKKGLKGADNLDPVEFDITGSFSDVKDILIQVERKKGSNTWTELKAPKGTAASKICVDTDFKWPDERESLKARYPDFVNYVRDNLEVDSWWKDW